MFPNFISHSNRLKKGFLSIVKLHLQSYGHQILGKNFISNGFKLVQ